MPPFVVKKVPLPAVALLLNNILSALMPKPEEPQQNSVWSRNCSMMPTPLKVSVKPELAVIVKLLAPGAKVIPSTIVFAELETVRRIRESKCRRVCRPVRHGRGRPVRRGIPVARAGIKVPCRATGTY